MVHSVTRMQLGLFASPSAYHYIMYF